MICLTDLLNLTLGAVAAGGALGALARRTRRPAYSGRHRSGVSSPQPLAAVAGLPVPVDPWADVAAAELAADEAAAATAAAYLVEVTVLDHGLTPEARELLARFDLAPTGCR